jgi:hypothetical protein
VTFCRTIMCTQGTHISLNTRVFEVFWNFFSNLAFFSNSEIRIFMYGQTVRFYFTLS